MLPVPGSEVFLENKYSRNLDYSHISGYDTASTASTPSIPGLYTFGHLHTRSISAFDTVVTPSTSSILGFDTVQCCLYLNYFRVL